MIMGIVCLFSLSNAEMAFSARQQVLQDNFDIVSTFDELQDWSGTPDTVGHWDYGLPVKIDGTPSVWSYYSYWASTPLESRKKWIGNHGSEYTLGEKSLAIDIGGAKIFAAITSPAIRTNILIHGNSAP